MQHSSTEQHFYASTDSPMARTRRHMRWVFVVPLLVLLFHPQLFTIVLTLSIILPFWWWLDRHYAKQLRTDSPAYTVSATGLFAPLQRGSKHIYDWTEVQEIAHTSIQQMPTLQLTLTQAQRRWLWPQSASRIQLPLSMLDSQTQARLIDCCLQQHAAVTGSVSAHMQFNHEMQVQAEFNTAFASLLRHPWLTYGLIALNVLIWLGMLANGSAVMRSDTEQLYVLGGLTTAAVQHGEWWRMLTATFLHGGLMHLGMNMIGLYATGIMAERIYGHAQFAILYLGAALTGSAMSMHFAAQEVISVGASGAIFGVAGALLVAVLQHRDKLPATFSKQTLQGVTLFIGYALLQGFSKQGVDNGAHIGGLIGGMIAAYVLPEKFDLAHYRRTVSQLASVTVVLMCVLTAIVAYTARPASQDPGQMLRTDRILKTAYGEYFNQMRALDSEIKAVAAGKMTEVEADQRSRAVHAPVFQRIAAALGSIQLPATDKRAALIADMHTSAALMAEWMAMDSRYDLKTGQVEPVDQQRAAELQEQLTVINQRILQQSKALSQQ